MNTIQIETATVYRAGGRRYFTLKSAIRKLAVQAYFKKHPCSCEEDVGFFCNNHIGKEEADWIIEKLIKRIKRKQPDPRPSEVTK